MGLYDTENLYIAGPECFYPNGYVLWWAQRKLAEYYGIPVVLPTSTVLHLDHEDLRENAKEIFDDLVVQVSKTTAIIADLETFRGCEPDGGTLFEMGWIWSKGGRVYGYSHDTRAMVAKDQTAFWREGTARDANGWEHPYGDLPFCPCVMASADIVQGDFKDGLLRYIGDLDRSRKGWIEEKPKLLSAAKPNKKRIFYATGEQYHPDALARMELAKAMARKLGFDLVCFNDTLPDFPQPESQDPLLQAQWKFLTAMALLKSSDLIIADFSNFHGWEPQSDVSFACGAAYGWGKTCIGFMPSLQRMRDRIPGKDGKDWAGNVIENFDLPINLMFGCTFSIVEGGLAEALARI